MAGVVDVGPVSSSLGSRDPVLMGPMVLVSLMPTGLSSVPYVIHSGFVALHGVMGHVVACAHYLLPITWYRRPSSTRVHMIHVAGMVMASAAIGNR